ncbi:MAG: hypothetical protein ACT4OX_16960 [Actinomycetota bacterium]
MILWRAFGSVFGAWNVFQSSRLDFRLVAAGAVAPLLLDAPFGAQAYAHTLLGAVVVLTVAMLANVGRGRRLRRRRALSFAIGWFAGLVLGGAWTNEHVFWWPAFGADRPDASLLPPWPIVVALEMAGVVAAFWCWRRFGLSARDRREEFVRRGRLVAVREDT